MTRSEKLPTTKERFIAEVERQGGTVLHPEEFKTAHDPMKVRCAEGHTPSPWPSSVLRGRGICQKCGDLRRRHESKKLFIAEVERQGGTVLHPERFKTVHDPMDVRCPKGHEHSPWPSSVLRGRGICETCGPLHEAKKRFFAAVADQEGEVLNPEEYKDTATRVLLRCPKGHTPSTLPATVLAGGGICTTCTRKSAEARDRFFAAVADQGGEVLSPEQYKNVNTRVHLRCAEGHTPSPFPAVVLRGHGICRECHQSYNRLYVVEHKASGSVKVGVASSTHRVQEHLSRGYTLVAQWTGLTHLLAYATEQATLSSWREAGVPVMEYAPPDGRTETAPLVHLADTLLFLRYRLGRED